MEVSGEYLADFVRGIRRKFKNSRKIWQVRKRRGLKSKFGKE